MRDDPLRTAVHPEPAPSGRAIFIDKDGTLVEDIPNNVDPAKLRFTPRAIEGLRLLADNGYRLMVVTNQPGLAYGMFSRLEHSRLRNALGATLESAGVHLTDFYTCPHAPAPGKLASGCLCRIPSPGLLRQAARKHGLDLARSWMIGDLLDDVEAGRRAGCRTVLLDVGSESEWRLSPLRTPHCRAGDLLQAAQAILECDSQDGDERRRAAQAEQEQEQTVAATHGPLRRSATQAAAALQAAMSLSRFAKNNTKPPVGVL